ncbi:hypothetical protein BD311DRAFT_154038 [Dichomitus squalens]|uniref:Uncharacterized protein n=1 Tax=Dichomitus squalens TaxID=114155 RepID=A0A4Q9M5Q6_9APHY|nr:hypothetical protein BD311DRAFT_154038 [Dichomitus squalens]
MDPSSPAPDQPTTAAPQHATPQNAPADASPSSTSNVAPAAAEATAAVTPADRPWLTFPPFPKPPQGVDLVPFQDFKPLGIHIPEPVEDGAAPPVEVDGLGIATLTLRVHHDLTTMEKRKRKNARTKIAPDGSVVPKRWYEEWAEVEHLRKTSGPIDPSLPRAERLYQAAADFKSGRLFSPNHSVNQELTQYWDKFRYFVGLISNIQPLSARKKNAAAQQTTADDGDEELDEMPNARLPKEATIAVAKSADIPAGPDVLPASGPARTEEERQHRREYFREVRDTRMDRFLNDPEDVVKVFFSNYASDRGDINSEKFCANAPILIGFLLKFLQRNRVFPEIERQLRKAIDVTELAQKELPHAIFMNKLIPDDFGTGCREIFGAMNGYNIWADNSASEGDEAEEQRATKKQKTDDGDADNAQTTAAVEETAETTETVAKGDDPAEDPELLAAKKAEEVMDADADGAGSWGNAATTNWGDEEEFWGKSNTAEDWDAGPKVNAIHKFLGPTTLPLTHTTGVVERSTRRIKSKATPPAPPTRPQPKKNKGKAAAEPAPLHDPEAVERELDAKLAKLTLSAWPVYAVNPNADVQKPRILPDSRGAAVLDDFEGAEVAPGPGTLHNPFKDDIVVYVDPDIADNMWVGMSIEGVFVQLARVDPSVPIEVSLERFNNPWGYNKKVADGAPGVPVAPTRIWYMEEVRAVLPSYHTEMTPLPTDQDVFGEGDDEP